MEVILWAFSSMLLVMLIVYFLPLGLTKKGKVILVGTSFLLALGGIAATASFSFLITVLTLVVLILFVTYLLDQRLGKFLYTIDNSTEEVENEDFYMNADMQTAASHERVYQRENEGESEFLSLLKNEKKEITGPETKQNEENDLPLFETTGDEDISFLLDRTVPMEGTSKERKELKHEEVDYLAEIEELLGDDLSGFQSIDLSKPSQNTANDAESKDEIPVLSFEDKPEKKSESNTKSARKIEDFDEIPILPFHEQEEEQS